MGWADPGDAWSGPVTDMINTQIERRTLNVCRCRLQALANRGRHRTGKRQRQVQVGSRYPFYPFPQQAGDGLRQGGTHRVIRPQGKKQALP